MVYICITVYKQWMALDMSELKSYLISVERMVLFNIIRKINGGHGLAWMSFPWSLGRSLLSSSCKLPSCPRRCRSEAFQPWFWQKGWGWGGGWSWCMLGARHHFVFTLAWQYYQICHLMYTDWLSWSQKHGRVAKYSITEN